MLWLPGSITALEIMPDGSARWSERDGRSHRASNLRVDWCSESLMVLGLRKARFRWTRILLLSDSADPDALRCLRVWFRWRPE